MQKTEFNNIPQSIEAKIGKNLHLIRNHPICIVKEMIFEYFNKLSEETKIKFETFDDLNPVVSISNNFDKLLIPDNHPSRSKSDTYYVNESHVLRTHTSAHQSELLEQMKYKTSGFLAVGDVYRKDEIDSSHYPVFHQLEGVCVFDDDYDFIDDNDDQNKKYEIKNGTIIEDKVAKNLIKVMIGLLHYLFPDNNKIVDKDYFPFTDPSYQIDVLIESNTDKNERWLEVLGCGVIRTEIIENCSKNNSNLLTSDGKCKRGWAFGIGLDRLAMILFKIPDIRLLWSQNEKFLKQFQSGKVIEFKPFSLLDEITRDVSFYIPELYTNDNCGVKVWNKELDMYVMIRECANKIYPDIISSVKLLDQFYNEKLNKLSRTYRIWYQAPTPDIKNSGEMFEIVNALHNNIVEQLETFLNVEIR